MDEDLNQTQETSCSYKCGPLPHCAPLATAAVPAQTQSDPRYKSEKALVRGTLFPGLDLPLGNVVNTGAANTPAAELMAIDFAAHELSLYLDTHPEDGDAFQAYRDLLRLAEEGRRRYVRQYGPVCKTDLADEERYTWLVSPWPWEYDARREG